MRRTYGCAATTKLPRNAADGLFTKPSRFVIFFAVYSPSDMNLQKPLKNSGNYIVFIRKPYFSLPLDGGRCEKFGIHPLTLPSHRGERVNLLK